METEQTGIPHDAERPAAVVDGNIWDDLPAGLYVPPRALRVLLENFQGPLELLLYLIRKQDIDILDIPIARITDQYARYISLMRDMKLELAGEYLVMAAILAEIKSRMLLPRPLMDDDEEDPRADLVRRITEYERYREAALKLDEMDRMERDILVLSAHMPTGAIPRPPPKITLSDIQRAFADILIRNEQFKHHVITGEPLSVRERMSTLLEVLTNDKYTDFNSLYTMTEGRPGVIVTLLAVLEMLREAVITVTQNELYGSIHIKSV